jgi:hypothetical protein
MAAVWRACVAYRDAAAITNSNLSPPAPHKTGRFDRSDTFFPDKQTKTLERSKLCRSFNHIVSAERGSASDPAAVNLACVLDDTKRISVSAYQHPESRLFDHLYTAAVAIVNTRLADACDGSPLHTHACMQ